MFFKKSKANKAAKDKNAEVAKKADATKTESSFKFDNNTLRAVLKSYFENRNTIQQKYGNIGDWDVSDVTDMSELFKDKYSFDEDISNWNVSNVTTMKGMFRNTNVFNQPIGKWGSKTGNVVDMSKMFAFARGFNQSIGDWDTKKVEKMRHMFYFAENFNQPLGKWGSSELLNLQKMMYDRCTISSAIDEINWHNEYNFMTHKNYVFEGANNFVDIFIIKNSY
jgi:surface protein